MEELVLQFSVQTGITNSEVRRAMNLEWCRKGMDLTNQNLLTILSAYILPGFIDLVEYNIVSDTKAPLLRCFPFISKLKAGDIIITVQ